MIMRKLLAALGVCLFFVSTAYASDFTYRIPDSWVDLTDPSASTDGIPPFVVQEARSGKYIHYAVDPRMVTAQGAPVSFNVIEQAGKGRVTIEQVQRDSEQMKRQMGASGITMTVRGTEIQQLKGVDIGVLSSLLETPRGDLTLTQYMIPGKTHIAVLTYGCPPEALQHYRQIFQQSAMSTTGAYQHKGIDFGRALQVGVVGGVLGGIVALIIFLANRKKPATVAPTARPISGGTPIMWDCATCKRRVPMRFDVCRCGAARPA